MNNVGICFPGYDYEKMSFETLSNYLLQFLEAGITSFDFYTTMFLKNDDKLNKLVKFLINNNIKITFHYNTNKKFEDLNYEELLNQYKDDLVKVRNTLKIYNINYPTTIVFHGLPYQEEWNKHDHQNELIKLYKELSDFSIPLNFIITIETLSKHHPIGNHIGDDIHELELITSGVNNENFGICWDIGHTRLNNIEFNSELYLSKELLSKVKFTHIHNIALNKSNIDHLPITDLNYQKDELEYLIKNDYQGVYSIEIETKNLKENILIYLNSIKNVKQIIKEMEENYYELRKNS
ncbi:MAG: TIM barrel protein [Bacilli bacterium]